MSSVALVSDWSAGFSWKLTEKGGWNQASLHNLHQMMEHHPKLRGMFMYDELRDRVMVMHDPDGGKDGFPVELNDNFETDLTAWINNEGLAPSIAGVHATACALAARHSVNPLRMWLERLRWDGVPRVRRWLNSYAGVESTPYSEIVGERFLVSCVARALKPGCKVDTMLILEGPQGLRKSTLARVLAGEAYFSDQLGDVNNKDTQQAIQGYWIIEVAEMNHFSRAEDKAAKEFLSKREDRYRPPYGRNTITRKRRGVFIGTINPDGNGYLKDPTGARRYWPVTCTAIDVEALEQDREQLWAEAVQLYRGGQIWWIDPEEEDDVKREQADRQDTDVWTPKIAEWLLAAPREFTAANVLSEAILMPSERQSDGHKKRVAAVLKSSGYGSRPGRLHGVKCNIWFPVK